jgi:excisionase family DNA binding protein
LTIFTPLRRHPGPRRLFTDYRRPLETFAFSFRAAIGLYFFKEFCINHMAMNSEPPGMGASRAGPDPMAERLAYSVDEAAQLTGLSRDLLYDQMRRGNLPYVKIGRRRLITRQHLQQFLGVSS